MSSRKHEPDTVQHRDSWVTQSSERDLAEQGGGGRRPLWGVSEEALQGQRQQVGVSVTKEEKEEGRAWPDCGPAETDVAGAGTRPRGSVSVHGERQQEPLLGRVAATTPLRRLLAAPSGPPAGLPPRPPRLPVSVSLPASSSRLDGDSHSDGAR